MQNSTNEYFSTIKLVGSSTFYNYLIELHLKYLHNVIVKNIHIEFKATAYDFDLTIKTLPSVEEGAGAMYFTYKSDNET